MNDKIINCKIIAEKEKRKIKEECVKLSREPCLAVILIGNDYASEKYVANKIKACNEVGILSKLIRLPITTTELELLKIINELNNSKDINGILVQLPIPKNININNIIKQIDIKKDVDCFHPYNIGLLDKQNSLFKPCTALGVIEILKSNNIGIQGANIVIVGRSDIVGKPLATLLLKEDATVTICHSKTKNLQKITRTADILIVAIGSPNFIKKEMIKQNCVIIDVGINRNEQNKLCGDVDFNDVLPYVKYITPVPNGVGVLTVTMLLKNCLNAYIEQNKK